jgi:uncharacterized RDD family membrane protein YckC
VNERDVSAGLLVIGVRAGLAAGRLAVLPVRVLVRGPLQPFATRAEARVAQAGADARRRAQARARAATPDVEHMLDRALDGPLPDIVVKRMVDHVLESGELDRVVEHVAASPAVREAVARQTSSFADEVGERVRIRAAAVDDRLESWARAVVLRKPPRVRLPYGGLATRGFAFAVDLLLVGVGFLAVTGFVALAAEVLGNPSHWLLGVLLASGWSLTAAVYFVFFWTTAGQTPGMRVVHQRIACKNGSPPNALRAVVRYVVLIVLCVGAVTILFDKRRRALHDMVAGTTVASVEPVP